MSVFLIFLPDPPAHVPLLLDSPLKWILRQQFPNLIIPALSRWKHLAILDLANHLHLLPLSLYFPYDFQRVGCRRLSIMDYFTNSRMWVLV